MLVCPSKRPTIASIYGLPDTPQLDLLNCLLQQHLRDEVAPAAQWPPLSWLKMRKGRCLNGHIVLYNYYKDTPCCTVCNSAVTITFPEDRPGPLEHILGMP